MIPQETVMKAIHLDGLTYFFRMILLGSSERMYVTNRIETAVWY
jgi:hypothetical protein